MVEIYVIRHGKTEMNERKIIMGTEDSPLLSSALNNIKKLAAKLKRISFDVIFSSDLGRAEKTAILVSKNLGYPVEVILSKKLREIDYGKLSGMSKTDARKKYSLFHKDISFVNPGGESFRQLYLRVVSFIKSIDKKYDRILLVTHAGCIRAIYSYCNNENFKDNINMEISHDMLMKCIIDGKNMNAKILQN